MTNHDYVNAVVKNMEKQLHHKFTSVINEVALLGFVVPYIDSYRGTPGYSELAMGAINDLKI